MGEYDRAIATAKRLIEKKGALVDWVETKSESGAEPWKGKRPNAPQKSKVKIVFFPPDTSSRLTLQQMTGLELPKADEYGLMPTVNFVPKVGDIVERNGVALAVVGCAPLAPGGVVVLYTLWFTR